MQYKLHKLETVMEDGTPVKQIITVEVTKQRVWDHFFDGKFKQQIHQVSWLIEKFWPIPPGAPDDKRQNKGWTTETLNDLKRKESASKA